MLLCLMIQRVHLIIYTEEKIVEIFLRFSMSIMYFIFHKFDLEMKSTNGSLSFGLTGCVQSQINERVT